jgi:HAMP domain-containing protein
MRLAWKLTLGFVIGIAAVMAGNAWLHMRRQAAIFDFDTRRDHWLLARALRQGSDLVERLGDEDSVHALVDGVDRNIPGLHVRLVRADDVLGGSTLSEKQREKLERTGSTTATAVGPDGEERRYTYELLSSEPWMAIEISESLQPQITFMQDTALQVFWTTILLVLLCGGIALALGILVVARPMRLLSDKARRVGLGDFSGPLYLGQQDEIGELAQEINAMCERLAAATAASTSAARSCGARPTCRWWSSPPSATSRPPSTPSAPAPTTSSPSRSRSRRWCWRWSAPSTIAPSRARSAACGASSRTRTASASCSARARP